MKNKLARLSLVFNFTFFILHSPAAFAGYLQHVAVDMSDSRQNFPLRVARGEVVDLSVDFFDEGDPIDFEAGASATLHTRTNGMDAAYSWRTSGNVSSNAALFVLDVDAVLPAASGEWTVVVEGGGRVLARAGGQAYVRGGAAASVAADPVSALLGYATTGYVAQAVAAIDIPSTNGFLRAESDPAFSAWAADNTSEFAGHAAAASFADEATKAETADYAQDAGVAERAGRADYAASASYATNTAHAAAAYYADTAGSAEAAGEADYARKMLFGSRLEDAKTGQQIIEAATNYTDAAIAAIDIPDPDLSFTNDYVRAEDVGGAAYADVSDFATPSEVSGAISAASNALARAWSADSALLSSMLLGSNVVAEVTNYNSQVRSPTLRLLQLNESNEYFQVWAETNNLSRVALAATNHADAVSAAAYNAATNYAAPRAWSGTTSGLGADAPEGWTWISTPNLAIGGGLEFEKHVTGGGEIWVLKNNGMVAQFNALTNNAAYLEIASLDGESVFRIEKTDSVLLGVDTTSVSVDGNTLVCGVAAVSAEHPLARVRASLTQGDWTREEDGTQSGSATILPGLATVEWSGQSGAWVCRITNDTGGHSIFATMQYLQEGGTKIVPAAPMDGSAGILCTDGVHKVRPVYSNGSVTWEVFQ